MIKNLHFQLGPLPILQTLYPHAYLKSVGSLIGILNLACPKKNSIHFPNLFFPKSPPISMHENSIIPVVQAPKLVWSLRLSFFLCFSLSLSHTHLTLHIINQQSFKIYRRSPISTTFISSNLDNSSSILPCVYSPPYPPKTYFPNSTENDP